MHDQGEVEEFLQRMVGLARLYRERFQRPLPITGELGELYASARLGLELVAPGMAGYDAVDRLDPLSVKKVQIKSRAPFARWDATAVEQIVNPAGRIGRFKGWDFDYALLVMLDGDYGLQRILRAEASILQEHQDRSPNRGIHVSTFLCVAVQVWPTTR